jgi:hypothetical protein
MMTPHQNNFALSFISRILFPRSPAWLRRREARFLLLSLTLGVAVCVALGASMIILNRHRGL